MIAIASVFEDPSFVLMAASFTLLIGLGVGQIDLVSRTEGAWRAVAAIPTMVIALYVVLNIEAPRSAWPETLMIWTVVAAVVHLAAWFVLRLRDGQPQDETVAEAGAHCADCARPD